MIGDIVKCAFIIVVVAIILFLLLACLETRTKYWGGEKRAPKIELLHLTDSSGLLSVLQDGYLRPGKGGAASGLTPSDEKQEYVFFVIVERSRPIKIFGSAGLYLDPTFLCGREFYF